MLIPFYFLIGAGAAGDRVAATIEDDRLHAGRLAADAGRGDRDRGARRRRDGRAQLLDRRRCAQNLLADGQPGVDLLLLRGRLPGQDAGLPAPRLDARRLPRRAAAGAGACSRACSRRSAPTASCGSCCRSSPTRRSHFQEVMLVIAVASILYGSVMAFTQTNVRLVAGYSSIAQLGFITARRSSPCAPTAPTARSCRWSTTGSSVAADLRHHRAARRAHRDRGPDREMGGHGEAARRCSRRCS